MDDNDEDEIYADVGFDSLPQDELLLLEQNAIRATQHQQDLTDGSGYLKIPPHAYSRQPSNETNLGNQTLRKSPLAAFRAPSQPASSDYGELDPGELDAALLGDFDEPVPVEEKEEVDTARLPGAATQRDQWRQQRYGRPNVYNQKSLEYSKPTEARNYLHPPPNGDSSYQNVGEIEMQDAPVVHESAEPPPVVNAEALQVQIQEVPRLFLIWPW
jgi:hypothetical protein